MRIFLAIDLPGNIKNKVMELEEKLKSYSKYMRLSSIDNLHFTVKFLGDQNDFAVDKIKEISKDAFKNMESFEISLNKSGLFGGLRNPRILWLGDNNRAFENMAKSVHERLDMFRHEDKKPLCHLTIGRIKNMPKTDALEVLGVCKEFVDKNNLRFEVHSVYLYKSSLFRSGAIYEKIEKFSMKEK